MQYVKRQHETGFFAVDLFAGCGGLTEGFKQAGVEVVADVEMNEWACQTLRTRHLFYELKRIGRIRLFYKYLREQITEEEIFKDYPAIRQVISKRVIQATLGRDKMSGILQKIRSSLHYHGGSKVHVLLGGPPCQPYSLIGRARDPDKMENDDRHYLYRYYLKILSSLKPDFFVYENVPGLFSARAEGQEIFSRMLDDFSSLDPPYEITPPLELLLDQPASYILDSAAFGVPQHRKRLILIGYRKSLEPLNLGIINIFKKLQKRGRKNIGKGCLTVEDAIGDLPALEPGQGNDGYYGPYSKNTKLGPYQRKMRRYSPGFLNHRARSHMESDIERYRFFIRHYQKENRPAKLDDLLEQRPDLTPDHNNLEVFNDRFKVQWWSNPSSTIMAHISKDGHYYIHPDADQGRSFTVREAARCQSFPDNFKFEGSRLQQFKQVGNAVPPLLAYNIAKAIYKELSKIYESY